MTTHDESPIIRTSKKRLAQGLAIVVITMAVGAAIAVPYWNQMAEIPPPVSTIVIENPVPPEGEDELEIGTEETQEGETGGAPSTGGAEGGATPAAGTTITILAGSSVQGNPDYEPEDTEVPLNENVVWVNKDTVPHTATSGTGAEDPDSGKIFDTSIINAGEESSPVQLTGVKEGDEIAVDNEDSTPHTVTNGKDATDPNMGKLFDTSTINAGESSECVTTDLKPGEYPYFCSVHPYMTGTLTVQ